MTIILEHPELGTLIGVDKDSLVQYRGVKYASLQNRFAEPVLFTNPENKTIQATGPGPCAVSHPAACEMEFGFIQKRLPHDDFSFSDTECLNLNIVCPKIQKHRMPVFVYLHGGGYSLGANSWPQYDLCRIVELSIKRKNPIIAININYRLGVNGFLTSPELEEAGFKPNRGLRDQQIAFKWIQQHINGFGGDSTNITAVGESVGGVALFYHLNSSERLFDQLVSMAGTPLLMPPLPGAVAQQEYRKVLDMLGLGDSAVQARVEQLLVIPAAQMIQKIAPSVALLPVIDGDIIKFGASFADWETQIGLAQHHNQWCSRILIGDCQFDANISSYMIQSAQLLTIKDDFCQTARRLLNHSPQALDELIHAYKLDDSHAHPDDVENVLNFGQDIGFSAPVKIIAENWQGSAFVYRFNELNPWDGRWQGHATHILDILFLLQNYNDSLSEKQRLSAQLFAEHVINFCYGQEPFPAYNIDDGGAMVYGSKGEGSVEFIKNTEAADHGRRGIVETLARNVSLDVLSSIWSNYMANR